MYIHINLCMYVCMYVCMHACMYLSERCLALTCNFSSILQHSFQAVYISLVRFRHLRHRLRSGALST